MSYAWRLYRNYSDELARSMFRFSILYLALLFGALPVSYTHLDVYKRQAWSNAGKGQDPTVMPKDVAAAR